MISTPIKQVEVSKNNGFEWDILNTAKRSNVFHIFHNVEIPRQRIGVGVLLGGCKNVNGQLS